MTNALSMCQHLAGRLTDLEGTSLKLHSMFDRSANFLAADDHLVTFLAAQTPLAPSSLELPVANIREFFGREQELIVGNTAMQGRSLEIQFAKTRQISPMIQDHSALEQGSEFIEQIKKALLRQIPERGIYREIADCQMLELPKLGEPPLNGRYAKRFARFIENFSAADLSTVTNSERSEEMTETLKGLIGYGAGLTPAADDFILGVLAVCSHKECFPSLASACRANLDRTTTISAEMLYHGSEKRFSQSIVRLFAEGDTDNAITQLLDYGHSSGHDTLCGIYAGLVALAKRPL